MAYSEKFKARVRAEFEVGATSKSDIAKRYKIPRKTLLKWAEDGKWVWQESNEETLQKVTESTTKKLANEISYQLEDFTKEHVKAITDIAKLTKATVARLGKAIQSSNNNMSRSDAEAIFSQQKVLKLAGETLTGIYNDKRKALGLDKEKSSDTTVNVNNSPPQITLVGVKPDEPCPK